MLGLGLINYVAALPTLLFGVALARAYAEQAATGSGGPGDRGNPGVLRARHRLRLLPRLFRSGSSCSPPSAQPGVGLVGLVALAPCGLLFALWYQSLGFERCGRPRDRDAPRLDVVAPAPRDASLDDPTGARYRGVGGRHARLSGALHRVGGAPRDGPPNPSAGARATSPARPSDASPRLLVVRVRTLLIVALGLVAAPLRPPGVLSGGGDQLPPRDPRALVPDDDPAGGARGAWPCRDRERRGSDALFWRSPRRRHAGIRSDGDAAARRARRSAPAGVPGDMRRDV